MEDTKDKKFIVLDGNSLIYRAYHAIDSLMTSQGVATNAVLGFTNMLFRLIAEQEPDYLAVAFDIGKITFRHEALTSYKGQRAETPEDLRPQFSLVKRVLRAMKIPIFEMENYEADDLIGTLTRLAEEQGLESIIVSGDQDVLQLVGRHTRALITRRGISNTEEYNLEKIAEKYEGLSPQQLVDVKALQGDVSDNIPGIPSVGKKTAIKLIKQFGNLENLLQHRQEVRGKVQDLLGEYEEQVKRNKWLVTIAQDAPIEVDWEQCRFTNPDYDELLQVFQELEFRNLIKKITASKEADSNEKGTQKLELKVSQLDKQKDVEVERKYWRVEEKNDLSTLDEQLQGLKKQAKPVAVYVEADTKSWDREVVYINLCWNPYSACQLKFPREPEAQSTGEGVKGFIKKWLEDKELPKVFHDAKNVLIYLDQLGIKLQGLAGDTMLEAYLINPGLAKLTLEDLSVQYLNQVIFPSEDRLWSDCLRADTILQLHHLLQKKLSDAELESLYKDIELPLVYVLVAMQKAGVRLDATALEAMSKDLGIKIEELTREIYDLAGEEFNINSPRQLGVILFEKLKLPVIKKTKTGYSTAAEVLEELSGQHEIVAKIFDYRQLVKLKSTYVDGMRQLIDPKTGKVHTTFNQAITATGRLSSTEPNLQNIPIRFEFGRQIRKFFTASEPDWLILAADYSQIELRVLAHISGDEKLIRAFQGGQDIHINTASQVFNVPEDQVTKQMRYRAKAVNFGIVYGMTEYGLARDLGIPRAEAQQYIKQYLSTYHGVKDFMVQVVKKAREMGYVTTLLGRRRYIPELFSNNRNVRSFGERAAINTAVQGTAADIIKIAMLRVTEEMHRKGLQARMLLQVHDELIFEVPAEEIEVMVGVVREAMEKAVTLCVPLVADIKIGSNWYDLKKYISK